MSFQKILLILLCLKSTAFPGTIEMSRKMTTIGVAGVTIPGAVDCINKINRSSSAYFGNNEHPNVILYQPNFGILQAAFKNDDWGRVLLELSNSVEALAQMGADFVIVPANTVHRVIIDLQKQSSIPILNMLEIVSEECKEKNIKKIGILGTTWTMSGHLYKESMEAQGIEEIIPSEEEQNVIQNSIFSEIIPTGSVKPATLEALLNVIKSLQERECDGIALACTELPLVLNEDNCEMPVIDTTNALAKAAVKKAAELAAIKL